MHMADALISPAVGGIMWAATIGTAAFSVKKIKNDMDEKKIPLMGVMGAFVFAAQMINFTVPGTGSSGHIGGGILLSALLGPYAGFLTMASVLLIQALFFADGGLLAYGCNVFNLGFFTCFIAYPLIFRWITRKGISAKRIFSASIFSVVAALQAGAFSVVLQTLMSGKTELPFGTFVLLMQPVHLAIGLVEGLVTAAVVAFVWKARPEIIENVNKANTPAGISFRKVLITLTIAAVVIGGSLSWFASAYPDGLEWSMFKTAGTAELEASGGIYDTASGIQDKTAILPDYNFKVPKAEKGGAAVGEAVREAAGEAAGAAVGEAAGEAAEAWPAVNAGTSISGLAGGAMTLVLATFTGLLITIIKRRKKKAVV